MLTAARLISAILFAVLAYYSAGLMAESFPDGMSHDWFEPSIGLIGLWQGWMVMGRSAGMGYTSSMGIGLRTSVQIAFFGLVFWALAEMFRRSANLRYNDFGRALVDALNLFIEYLMELVAVQPAWITLLVGGMVIGAVAEASARLWR
ncbi:TrgA family protein [Rhodobacterales bacterium HKCCE2091]|nr:TrgA family protein [Rhodobacterales bacterium HKCCE2091]